MKSKFFLVAFIAATVFALTQSGKLYAQSVALADDESIVECDEAPGQTCAIINGITFFGKVRKP